MKRNDWIQKAEAALGKRWDYSLVPDVIMSEQKIPIICPEHGVFEQNEKSHRKGILGCRKCYGAKVSKRYLLSAKDILDKLPLQETDYMYCLPQQGRMSDKITIRCPRHGVFTQALVNHITVGQRCPACSQQRIAKQMRKGRRWFVNKARRIHNGAYGYWAIGEDITANDRVPVWCPKHGWFHVLVHNHISHRSRCPKCAIGTGKGEQEIAGLYPGALLRQKGLLSEPCSSQHELDVWWPDKRVGVELHGALWHSTWSNEDAYHIARKADAAEFAGIRLLQIYDFEWHNRRALFGRMVLAALGRFEEVFMARKLQLADVSNADAEKFLCRSHPKRHINARHVGLFDGSRLVLLASYGKGRFAKHPIAELYRLASLPGIRVIGGLSRLVKHIFEREAKPVVSYVDRRLYTGRGYEAAGFRLVAVNRPGYIYVDRKGNPVGSRILFQKHRLEGVLERFDPKLSEEENMRLNGYYRLYDAGTKTFIYEGGR